MEFEAHAAGQRRDCPSCLREITLPAADGQSDSGRRAAAPVAQVKAPKAYGVPFMCVGLSVVALVLVVQGCSSEVSASTVFQQLVATIQSCCGWVLIGIVTLIQALPGGRR